MKAEESSVYKPLRSPWHEELKVRGIRHHLTWWGERTDTPIVLLHGYLDCGATWQFLADCLPSAWTLVAPDWRGFGASEWAAGGYWFPDYLADLEVLLDALVPHTQARIIAHSMGANVAMLYGGIRPARLGWLANLEGLGLRRTAPDEAPARYAQWLDELRQPLRRRHYRSVAQLADILRERNPRLTPERAAFIACAWTRTVSHGVGTAREEPRGAVELSFDPRHRLVNPVLYRREEAEACWARIEASTLLVLAEQSEHRTSHVQREGDDTLSCLFKHLRIVTIPGVGHMMHHEDPDALAPYIIDLDRNCRATSR